MKKKLVTLMLSTMVVMSLTACGAKEAPTEKATEPTTTVEATTEVATEASTEAATEAATETEATTEVAVEDTREVDEDMEVATLDVEMYVANSTGADFTEIYVSVAGEDAWGENLLGADEYLPSNAMLPVMLSLADEEGLKWDLRVVDPNGEALEWYGIDISEMPMDGFAIELFYDGTEGTAKLAETPDELEGSYTE